MPCVVTSTAAYSKVLSSMENALIMLEIAAKCSNYAKNWGLCLFFWIMLFEAEYAKNYASILYQCLAQERQKASRSGSPQNVLHCLVWLLRRDSLLHRRLWVWVWDWERERVSVSIPIPEMGMTAGRKNRSRGWRHFSSLTTASMATGECSWCTWHDFISFF